MTGSAPTKVTRADEPAPPVPTLARRRGSKRTLAQPFAQAAQTVADTALQLCISERSIWRLIALKELEVIRCGRSVRIKSQSIAAFLDRGGTSR